MQLTSLEIQGFKSFADKTKFLFDKGITGVVGPNGCGKSNIVDSIRWVLGEQKTRKLRSEKMQNVIFNGTSKRKRGNYAMVTLTFENTKNILPTEYTTVAVTRKLYRNGDSDYLINDIPCRLKDIHNLFLDTGIGPDSYAIIELKMVDDILNDKENSRRLLFEEAAGISKYKIRKRETLRRLNATQSDLDRVEDVLFEIQKQLKSLESQARKARRYFELKAKYKLLSSQHAFFTIRELRGRYEAIEREEKGVADRLTALQSGIAKREARVQELRKEQLDQENQLSAAQKDLNAHNARILEIEKEKSIKNERLKYLQQREFAIGDQLEKEKRQAERTQEELGQIRDKAEAVRKDFTEHGAVLEALRHELAEAKSLQEEQKFQVEGYASEHRELEMDLNRLAKEKEIKQIQIEGFRKEIERNEADRTSKKDELDSFAQALQTLEVEVAGLDQRVTELRQKKTANDAAREESTRILDELRDQIYRTSRGLDARMNEYNLTKSLVENLEGFPESVKFLKKEASWVKDAPLLSDIFATDEVYKVALENLLDPYLSYYIVETRADAMQAVRLLSDAAKGRANFFILEELADYSANPRMAHPGASPALALVEVNEKYRKLAEYLLDRVYIVNDESEIPEVLPAGALFLTKNGGLQRRPYSLSGGSIGLFQGKRLGRAKNLEKLRKEIKQLEKELNQRKTDRDAQEKRHQKLKENNFGKELDRENQIFQTKKRDLSVLQARETEYKDFIAQAGERSEVIVVQVETLEREIAAVSPRIVQLQATFVERSRILEEARRMLDNSTEEASEKSQSFNQQNIRYIQAKNHLEMLEREAVQKSEQLAAFARNDKMNKADLEETKKNIHELVQTNLQNDDQMIALYEEKKRKEDQTGKLEHIVATKRMNIQEFEDDVRKERRKKDELEAQRNATRERVTEIRIELNGLKERMQVEFEVDISDLDEADLFAGKREEVDPAEIETQMLKLRQRLQKYGEINPMAVEAFDEMKERHDFIDGQRNDLVEAKQTLLDTIAEIDETATEKFRESFVQIRTNFKRVFQHLFQPGDTCDLTLVDPSDPLDSSIDIMAKPKGKRPLTINQLSGGEKTLTAVALLFAIYLLKPAPFCIFDEVDAPLDDANIDKFNNIIREFSKDSQFIIVTHNKRTMAATNVMYGVTMQEQGVSKVLPVDLVSLNLDLE
ncbi:MAG: chromosome segregation protein SMC [Bacteroidota bacterium]